MCYDHEGNWIGCHSSEFCTAEPPEPTPIERDVNGLAVHILDSEDAYAATQCDSDIKDGDVLIVAECGVVGFLVEAWPVALVGDHESTGFHTIDWSSDLPSKYEKSIRKACETGLADADITGNRDWEQGLATILNGLA